MKMISCFLLIFSILNFSNAQKPFWINSIQPTVAAKANTITCSSAVSRNCNFAFNPLLITNVVNYDPSDPFAPGQVDNWYEASGSPEIDPGFGTQAFTPPFSGSHGAYMQYLDYFFNNVRYRVNESILENIRPLEIGKTYSLTFYKKITWSFPELSIAPADLYNIYLVHCNDAQALYNPALSLLSNPPANSQQIFCQSSPIVSDWQQQSLCFTANSNYDMILVYPRIDITTNFKRGSIAFGYPELVSKSDFAINFSEDLNNPCLKTLSPSCTVKNATYQWYLNGILFSTLQNPVINTSNQYGTISLNMNLPNPISNCNGESACAISASRDFSICIPTVIWPKIYDAVEANGLKIDDFGNLFQMTVNGNMLNNINHVGPLPSGNGDYSIHYDINNGVTNWVANTVLFTLSNGTIQTFSSSNSSSFQIAANGTFVSAPFNIPSNEIIIAENNGTFITDLNRNLKIYPTLSNTQLPILVNYNFLNFVKIIFNPTTKNLYLFYDIHRISPSDSKTLLAVYNLSGNLFTSQIPTPFFRDITGYSPVQVTNSAYDEILLLGSNTKLFSYNYQANSYSILNIPGFTNNSLEFMMNSSQTVDDRFVIMNTAEQKFYFVNTLSGVVKKIDYTPPIPLGLFYNNYCFYNNEIYFQGTYQSTGFTIGSQSFPALASDNVYVTKFNLQTDFYKPVFVGGSRQNFKRFADSLINRNVSSVSIFPNPAVNNLLINIKNNISKKTLFYTVTIINSLGIKVLNQITSQLQFKVDISNLSAGIYQLQILNSEGEVDNKSFIKMN